MAEMEGFASRSTALPPRDTNKLNLALAALNDLDYGRKPLTMSQKMSDGSVYTGETPDGQYRIFTMPLDVRLGNSFNEAVKAVEQLNRNKALGHADWQLRGHDDMPIRVVKNQSFQGPPSR